MEITGKIIKVLPENSGEGKNGTWRSRDAVLETQEQYPRKVCFNLFGDKIDQFKFEEGDLVTVHFDIDSREYNGRWYTNIRAWKVDSNDSTPQQNMASTTAESIENTPNSYTADSLNNNSSNDDLPF